MRFPDQPVRIGMLGCGVVGSEVARLILADTAELSTRAGAKIELAKLLSARLSRAKEFPTNSSLLMQIPLLTIPRLI